MDGPGVTGPSALRGACQACLLRWAGLLGVPRGTAGSYYVLCAAARVGGRPPQAKPSQRPASCVIRNEANAGRTRPSQSSASAQRNWSIHEPSQLLGSGSKHAAATGSALLPLSEGPGSLARGSAPACSLPSLCSAAQPAANRSSCSVKRFIHLVPDRPWPPLCGSTPSPPSSTVHHSSREPMPMI